MVFSDVLDPLASHFGGRGLVKKLEKNQIFDFSRVVRGCYGY